MNYPQTIQYLYPSAQWGVDFTVITPDGSTEPEIANWNTAKLGPQPPISALKAAWPQVMLSHAQEAKLKELRASHQETLYSPVSFMGTQFPCTPDTIALIQASLAQTSLPSGFQWFDINSIAVPMNRSHLQELANLFFSQIYGAHQKFHSKVTRIKAAPDVSAVMTITLDS